MCPKNVRYSGKGVSSSYCDKHFAHIGRGQLIKETLIGQTCSKKITVDNSKNQIVVCCVMFQLESKSELHCEETFIE